MDGVTVDYTRHGCPLCKGAGWMDYHMYTTGKGDRGPCSVCQGKGYLTAKEWAEFAKTISPRTITDDHP